MKRFNNIIMTTLCLGLSTLIACDSYLDKEYDASISEEKVFGNATLTREFLNNIYVSLPDGVGVYNDPQFLGASRDCMTDNAVSFWGLHYYTKIATDAYTANDHPLLGFWNTNFTGIRKCNQFLKNASSNVISDEAVEGDDNHLFTRYCAEVKFMRALFHFELVAYFGDAPILDGVILDMNDQAGMNLTRIDAAEVLKWVADQCDSVKDVLPFRYASDGNWGRVNGASAYALKSRALLYRASALNNTSNNLEWWSEAAQAAQDFLDKNSDQLKPFSLMDDYQKCFYTTPYDNNEIILSRSIWYTNVVETNLLPEGFSGCTGRTNPTQNFVDAFEMANGKTIDESDSGYDPQKPYENRDPRLEAIVFHHGSVWGRADYNEERAIDVHFNSSSDQGADYRGSHGGTYTGYYLKKGVNPDLVMSDKKTFAHAWVIYRLAEIYLDLAEARNEALAAPDAIVYGAINTIRTRAGLPDLSGLTKEQMRKRIRNERRIELSFEDHRFFDLRRWKAYEGVTYSNESSKPRHEQVLNLYGVEVKVSGSTTKYTYNSYYTGTNATMTNSNLPVRVFNTPKNYYFPIPANEVKKAPNLGQNEGW